VTASSARRAVLVAAVAAATLGAAGSAQAQPVGLARCGSISGPVVGGRVVVRVAPRTGARTLARLAAAAGGSARAAGAAPGYAVLRLGRGESVGRALCRLAGDPRVLTAEPVRPVHSLDASAPNDPFLSSLWGMTRIGAPAAWAQTTGSPGVIVGIVDTGIDASVADLAPNLWTNPGESGTDAQGRDRATNGVDDDGDGAVDDVHGWNALVNSGNVTDDVGHGSHVAGTIGARGDDGFGVAGVTWNARLMPVKVLGADGSGSDVGVAQGLAYAASHGARIVSASLGGTGWSQVVADTVHAYPGTLFVFAAGNAATNVDAAPFFPCTVHAANSICVAATDASDALASFSNYGATNVDLAAPGVNVLSWWLGALRTASGTSMATPHVSGAAAELLALRPQATVGQVKAALLGGVDPVGSLAGRVASGGRLDVARAMSLLTTPGAALPVVSAPAVGAVTPTGATVRGSVDGGGSAVTWWLETGRTTAYGTHVDGGAADGSSAHAVSATLAGLAPSTLYHVRLVARGAAGTAASADVTFTTRAAAPHVTATTVATPTATSAIVTGTIDAGPAGAALVELGTSTAYGRRSAAVPIAASTTARSVRIALGGLAPATTYHVRVVATTAGGTAAGADATLTTPAASPPVVRSVAVEALGPRGGTIAASIDTGGVAAAAWVEYGSPGGPVAATSPRTVAAAAPASLRIALGGLAPATTYSFRVVARNGAGTTRGPAATFTTPASARTGRAQPRRGRTVLATARLAARGQGVAWWFEFGTTTAYGHRTRVVALAGGGGARSLRSILRGLTPATTYHLRVVVRTRGIETTGRDVSFRTT
jgi:subtilisin family serine protease